MNATVNAPCYMSITLANGENPLMIRVTKNETKSRNSTSIFFTKNKYQKVLLLY